MHLQYGPTQLALSFELRDERVSSAGKAMEMNALTTLASQPAIPRALLPDSYPCFPVKAAQHILLEKFDQIICTANTGAHCTAAKFERPVNVSYHGYDAALPCSM